MRDRLDLDYIISALLRGDKMKDIAKRESTRLGDRVTKNMIVALKRDLKAGKIKPSSSSRVEKVPTYIYGVEPDNGGIPVFTGDYEVVDDVAVINDVHIPFTDWEFADRALQVFQRQDLDTLIIAGDLIDFESQSKWSRLVPPLTLEQELRYAREFLTKLLDIFETVYYFRGNHEDRLLKALDGGISFGQFTELLTSDQYRGKLIVSPYPRIFVTSGDERWVIVHQRNTSVYKSRVAEQLSWKHQMNVLVTHQHTNAPPQLDRYANNIIMSVGGLHDPQKTAYSALQETTGWVPEKGFATIIEGRATLFTNDERITNWDTILE